MKIRKELSSKEKMSLQKELDNKYIALNENGSPCWLSIQGSPERALDSFLGMCGFTTSWDELECKKSMLDESRGKIRKLSDVFCIKQEVDKD